MTDVLIVIPFVDEVEQLQEVVSEINRQTNELNAILEVGFDIKMVCVNNSAQMPEGALKLNKIDNVTLLHEQSALGSPYSSRNRGIEHAQASAYLFLDVTCYPDADWVKVMYDHFTQGSELVAADVIIGDRKNGLRDVGRLYDAITNVDNEKSIKNSGGAKTACLYAHSQVVDSIGAFEERVRSGGDMAWTRKATSHNFKLVFEGRWRVLKTARSTKELLDKQWRVALAFPRICKSRKEKVSMVIRKVLFMWLPPKLSYISATAARRRVTITRIEFIKLFFFGWYIRLLTGVAVLKGLMLKPAQDHTK